MLQRGAVVASHGALPASDRGTLHDLTTGRYDERVAVTPYDDLMKEEVVIAG